jgi:hypothetical protein
MFEHFTFGALPQPRLATEDADLQASPTDTSFSSPLTPCSPQPSQHPQGLDTVVDKFSAHSLQSQDLLVSHFAAWVTDAEERPDGEDVCISQTITKHASLPTSLSPAPANPRGTVACRRLQRQLNVQLQTSATHVRDLNSLVSEMLETNSQCRLTTPSPSPPVVTPTSPPPVPTHPFIIDTEPDSPTTTTQQAWFHPPPPQNHHAELEIDEGFCEQDEEQRSFEEEMSLRRASTPSGIRKYNNPTTMGAGRWARSADCVLIGGKIKVKNVPRMRRRRGVPGHIST